MYVHDKLQLLRDTCFSIDFISFKKVKHSITLYAYIANHKMTLKFTLYSRVDKKDLEEPFLRDLVRNDDATYKRLAEILKNAKSNALKLLFHKSNDDYPFHYIVTIQGFQDHHLMKLGKQDIKFPRGLHIFWFPHHQVDTIFGFYPKFDNDSLQSPTTDFITEEGFHIAKKYSGSLACFGVCEFQGTTICASFSKNSADCHNPYVKANHEIFKKYIESNPAIITKMIASGMTVLCFEMMYKNDRTHGSEFPLEDTFVLTGGFMSNKLAREKGLKELCPTFPDWQRLASTFGLPVDAGYMIPDKKTGAAVFHQLNEMRDFMTCSMCDRLLEPYKLDYGNFSHIEQVGETLEGLILTSKTDKFKYKFPQYTALTMCLRPYFALPCEQHTDHILEKHVYNFCKRWCFSENGRKKWYQKLMTIGRMWNEGTLYPLIEEEHQNTGVGLHILAMKRFNDDVAMQEMCHACDVPTLIETPEDLPVLNMVMILGRIGVGKSKLAKKIQDLYPHKFHHIDGDKVCGLDMKDVMRSGQERQYLTAWDVFQTALLDGKIPILSCGGGVCFSKNGLYFQDIARKLGYNLRISLVLCTDNGGIDPGNNLDQVYEYYNDTDSVKDTVKYRLDEGIWKIENGKNPEKFAQEIAQKSQKNHAFWEKIACHPCCKNTWTSRQILDDLSLICNLDSNDVKSHDAIPCQQSRYLVRVNDEKIGHITIEFDPSGQILVHRHAHEKSKDELHGVAMDLPVYDLNNQRVKGVKFVWLCNALFPEAHVTLDAGPFQPKQMRDLSSLLSEQRSGEVMLRKNADTMLKVVLPKPHDIAEQLARKPVKIDILYGPFGIIF